MNATDDSEARGSVRYEIAGGQTVTVTLDPEDHREQPQVFPARLLSLSQNGARLSVPLKLPISNTLRLKFSIDEFALEFYVSADVCWSKPDGESGWQVGCAFSPGLPARLFDRLAAGGRLDRRNAVRHEKILGLRALKGLGSRRELVTLRNYSRGGFCVSASRPARPGERIHFCLEESKRLLLAATTEWQLKQGDCYLLGCTFVDENDFARLRDSCAPMEARQPAPSIQPEAPEQPTDPKGEAVWVGNRRSDV